MKKCVSIVLFLMTSCFSLSAAVIDFSTIDVMAPPNIGSIDVAVFSHDLYTHADGFHQHNIGGNHVAYNYYGEYRNSITFLSPVFLHSIDIMDNNFGLPVPSLVNFELYDVHNNLLKIVTVDPNATFQTVALNQNNVTTVWIDIAGGGTDFYGDGRDHAWWMIDNISYDPAQAVPEPSSYALILLGLIGFGLYRRKKIK